MVIAVGADAPHCTDFEGSGDPCLKFDLLARQTPALAVVTVLARWEPHRPNASQSTSPASDVVIAFKFCTNQNFAALPRSCSSADSSLYPPI